MAQVITGEACRMEIIHQIAGAYQAMEASKDSPILAMLGPVVKVPTDDEFVSSMQSQGASPAEVVLGIALVMAEKAKEEERVRAMNAKLANVGGVVLSDNAVVVALFGLVIAGAVVVGIFGKDERPKPGKPRQTTLQRARQTAEDRGCKRSSFTNRREFKNVQLSPGDCLLSVPKDDVPILVTSEGEHLL